MRSLAIATWNALVFIAMCLSVAVVTATWVLIVVPFRLARGLWRA